ncbi:hypothetical protein QBC35DRAFT_451557 [Podospora australis]|uniref:Uncharacterized protein n=1 Tax=Podospora australis TaxID=1536484 RepID=A0AAN6WTZ6_9PEZI|nr:hypothetical protein QBC35DRAFT_451557 [Podospora australis]
MSTNGPRFLIAVDYGTTYTGASWTLVLGGVKPQIKDIKIVQRWGASNFIGPKVPSVIAYSGAIGRRWGYGTALEADAHILNWTKLELEPPSRSEALTRLKKTLEATRGPASNRKNASALVNGIPLHLIKTTEDIVADYLTEVARCVRQAIENARVKEDFNTFPIDLIITHPAIWDARAMNVTFRAVNTAFHRVFPEMEDLPGKVRMTSESEACAQCIMRTSLSESKRELRRGACFVVVDAGGGTVDLVAYRIDQVQPAFQISRVTELSSGRYGATRIDEYFIKTFLPYRLSEDDYRILTEDSESDTGSGPHVRFTKNEQFMLDSFQHVKHKFAGTEGDEIILPGEIGRLDDPVRGISGGSLHISVEDLECMFQESVNGTVDLIRRHLMQLEVLRERVSGVFLSGGLSRSEYLFKKVEAEIEHRWKLPLLRGKNVDHGQGPSSWTDVAIGAAVLGLGIECQTPPECFACPYHIGVLVSQPFHEYENVENQAYVDMLDLNMRAKNHIKWIVARGDLVTQHGGMKNTTKLVRKIVRVGDQAMRGSVTIVTSEDQRPGDRPEDTKGLKKHSLNYDLGDLSPNDRAAVIRRYADNTARSPYRRLEMDLEVELNPEITSFKLLGGDRRGLCITRASITKTGEFISSQVPVPAVESLTPPKMPHSVTQSVIESVAGGTSESTEVSKVEQISRGPASPPIQPFVIDEPRGGRRTRLERRPGRSGQIPV